MAFPVVEGTAETAVTTAGTSHAITLPASIVSTDLVLIVSSIGSTAATMNALTNWTELLDENAAIGLKIWWYTGAGVPTTPTFTSSASTRSASIAWRISGADKTVTPQIGTTATGTSATPDPPASATPPSTKDYLFIAFAGMAGEEADDDTWGNTPPTNFTPSPPLQIACGTVGTSLGGLTLAASRQLNTGAAQNPGTFGVDVSAAWRAQTVTVHPSPSQSVTIGIPTETDAAGHLTQVHAANTATEADGAQALSIRVRKTLAIATEADSSRPLVVTKPIKKTLGVATSGGTAQPLVVTKPLRKTLGVAAEADAAQVLSIRSRKTLAIATEADSSRPLVITKPIKKTLGVATEADAAQVLSIRARKTLAIATEADSSRPLVITKPIKKTLGVATEADSARVLSTQSNKTLGVATEADASRPLVVTKTIFKTLGVATSTSFAGRLQQVHAAKPATEADSARPLVTSGPQHKTLGVATEVDSARTLVVTGPVATHYSINPAGEIFMPPPFWGLVPTEIARALDIDKRKTLGVATEADSARPLSLRIRKTLGVATETDTAIPMVSSGPNDYSITPALEADSARPLVFTKPIKKTLAIATEADSSRPLVVTKPIKKTLAIATEADSSRPLVVTKPLRKTVGVALESDTARVLSLRTRKTLAVAVEADLARPLTVTKPIRKTFGFATEVDSARPLFTGGIFPPPDLSGDTDVVFRNADTLAATFGTTMLAVPFDDSNLAADFDAADSFDAELE